MPTGVNAPAPHAAPVKPTAITQPTVTPDVEALVPDGDAESASTFDRILDAAPVVNGQGLIAAQPQAAAPAAEAAEKSNLVVYAAGATAVFAAALVAVRRRLL